MATIRKQDSTITKGLSEVEKNIGVDLKLTKENDLELTNLNDFKLIVGGENAAQAVKTRLFTEPGGLLLHPGLGTDMQIGEKTSNAFLIQTQIIKSLSQDPRFENVNASVSVTGNTIFVNLSVGIVKTGLQVPLKFAVEGQ